MTVDLFAGVSVSDFAAALTWYEKLFGGPPAFFPHDTEAVWGLAEHRWVYVVERPAHAGHSVLTVMVEDLDALEAETAQRGLEPALRETYDNGTRKTTYTDPDGNEIGFGAFPPESATP